MLVSLSPSRALIGLGVAVSVLALGACSRSATSAQSTPEKKDSTADQAAVQDRSSDGSDASRAVVGKFGLKIDLDSGGIESVTVGSSRKDALAGLAELGIRQVRGTICDSDRVVVRRAEDLATLRDEQHIVVNGGEAVLVFDPEGRVDYIHVAPVRKGWVDELGKCESRDCVFSFFGAWMAEEKELTVIPGLPDSRVFSPTDLSDEGMRALSASKCLSATGNDPNGGTWALHLEFDHEVLQRIGIGYLPFH